MFLKRINNKIYRSIQQIKNTINPGPLILMYHRVADIDSDPWSMAVTPNNFSEHLEVLKKYSYTLHLTELCNRLNKNLPLHRNVVVTFDDGYADNLFNAKPLIEKYDIPATIFITTSVIDKKYEYWWDQLHRLLLLPGSLPRKLRLIIDDNIYQWELGDSAKYTEEDFMNNKHWTIKSQPRNDPTCRHRIYRILYELLSFLSPDDRNSVLKELNSWANIKPLYQSHNNSLKREDLLKLAKGSLIDIGAHSITHPFLSELPINLQKYEIKKSKVYLEDILEREIISFAYPHGSYTTDTINIVKEAGFKCACTCTERRVKSNDDLFLLPRLMVKNWDGDAFSRNLSKCI